MIDVDGIKIPIGYVSNNYGNDYEIAVNRSVILEFRRYYEEDFIFEAQMNVSNNDQPFLLRKTYEKALQNIEAVKTNLYIFKGFSAKELKTNYFNELKLKKMDDIINNDNDEEYFVFKIHEIKMDNNDNLNKLKKFIDDYLELPENYQPIIDFDTVLTQEDIDKLNEEHDNEE